ncbi:TonB-dependent receptor domain-containing protein [Pasteurella sp. PK-2025]|uniref:TonB-dependent receptor n=1 Tax=Pasteurella sp. PK-2025 TaxID=3413133 RepID=UPI003C732CC1
MAKKKPSKLVHCLLPLSATALLNVAYAQTDVLDEIVVNAEQSALAGSAVENYQAISNHVIKKERLQKKSATLGNALAGELGVHSNPFGGGASAPIIRGQEGVRIKILQNGLDVVDMSTISPDHAVAADTLLAEQVELVRGASTLLYSTASAAGVINVVDKRIPTKVPEKGYEGEVFSRFDTASKETVGATGLTFKLHPNVALRLEGLKRYATHYRVPKFQAGDSQINYLPDSNNKSQVGTIGLSWVKDNSYFGVSYSERQDKYGLPGHNHKFDNCFIHIIDAKAREGINFLENRYYLDDYPNLADDEDLIAEHPHHCRSAIGSDSAHSHSNPFGNDDYNHHHSGPQLHLKSRRFDLRAQFYQPVSFLEKIRASFSYADYVHQEIDPGVSGASHTDTEALKKLLQELADQNKGNIAGNFKNRGYNGKIEFYHQPVAGLSGVLGLQYSEFTSSAISSVIKSLGSGTAYRATFYNNLVENTNKQLSFFATENYIWKDFVFSAGARLDKQKIPVAYDLALLKRTRDAVPEGEKHLIVDPDLSVYKQKAFSYLGSVEWLYTPESRVSFTYSRNERLPAPMELYYQGKHLATNSFEHGNKNLRKESSDNFELSFAYNGSKWDYRVNVFHKYFNNYIYNENLRRYGNLFVRRYIQSKAKFNGIEGEITYRPTPEYQITLFGDFVKGRLFDLPKQYYGKVVNKDPLYIYNASTDPDDIPEYYVKYGFQGRQSIQRENRYAPRVSPGRLGMRFNGEFTPNWSGFVEYTYVFPQKKTAVSVSFFECANESEDDRCKAELAKRGGDREPATHADLTPEEKARYNPSGFKEDEDLEYAFDEIANNIKGNDVGTVAVRENVYEDPSRGYHALNLGLRYQRNFKKVDYSVEFNVNNVLNQKIYIHTSHQPYVPQMGRNYVLSLGMKF